MSSSPRLFIGGPQDGQWVGVSDSPHIDSVVYKPRVLAFQECDVTVRDTSFAVDRYEARPFQFLNCDREWQDCLVYIHQSLYPEFMSGHELNRIAHLLRNQSVQPIARKPVMKQVLEIKGQETAEVRSVFSLKPNGMGGINVEMNGYTVAWFEPRGGRVAMLLNNVNCDYSVPQLITDSKGYPIPNKMY